MRFAILLLSLFAIAHVAADEPPCGAGTSHRTLTGPAPLTGKLHTVAAHVGGLLFDRGEFDDEQFTYVGQIKANPRRTWHVVHLSTTWGSSCRGTSRLLIFSADLNFVGQYSHFNARPLRVEGDSVIFDSPANEGNRITFTAEGPPKKAWFDGENFELYK